MSTDFHSDPNCIFCKIVNKQMNAKILYEDADFVAFHDIHPIAPIHFLIIPKVHISSMAQITEQQSSLLGKMMVLAPKLALEAGCTPYPEGGFQLMVNTGIEGGQEIAHLHLHVLGGPRPWKRG